MAPLQQLLRALDHVLAPAYLLQHIFSSSEKFRPFIRLEASLVVS
jgi:hypothetical protein